MTGSFKIPLRGLESLYLTHKAPDKYIEQFSQSLRDITELNRLLLFEKRHLHDNLALGRKMLNKKHKFGGSLFLPFQ